MKILAAMSGGVDSSVAALLLQRAGHEVVGVTLRLWHDNDDRRRPGGCCSLEDIADARRVCDRLGIAHYVFNYEDVFRKEVVEDFAREYLSGRTPNPCIVCNDRIKFGLLMERAAAIGFDTVATGHYARVEESNGLFRLSQGKDAAKDQSYVLYRLTQAQLSRLLLPLGGYTKQEIRRIAEEAGLPVSHKPDSQEICFVPDDYASFLRRYVPDAERRLCPGDIVDRSGGVLGRHRGFAFYTIGQRSGLGLTTPAPVYVTDIDVARNRIVVGPKEEVFSKTAAVEKLSWTGGIPGMPLRCAVKIRRLHAPAPAHVEIDGGRGSVLVTFDEDQPAVTPGQSAVFYDGDAVLGGGLIARR